MDAGLTTKHYHEKVPRILFPLGDRGIGAVVTMRERLFPCILRVNDI